MDIRNYHFSDLSELTSIGLCRGGTAQLENAQGTRLRVETGAIWITTGAGAEDVVLNAGETFWIESDGTTALSSLGRSLALVTLEPGAPAAKPNLLERLLDFWVSLYATPMPAPRTYL
jgi:hypothetical protein